jgi:hypothetical protein
MFPQCSEPHPMLEQSILFSLTKVVSTVLSVWLAHDSKYWDMEYLKGSN